MSYVISNDLKDLEKAYRVKAIKGYLKKIYQNKDFPYFSFIRWRYAENFQPILVNASNTLVMEEYEAKTIIKEDGSKVLGIGNKISDKKHYIKIDANYSDDIEDLTMLRLETKDNQGNKLIKGVNEIRIQREFFRDIIESLQVCDIELYIAIITYCYSKKTANFKLKNYKKELNKWLKYSDKKKSILRKEVFNIIIEGLMK